MPHAQDGWDSGVNVHQSHTGGSCIITQSCMTHSVGGGKRSKTFNPSPESKPHVRSLEIITDVQHAKFPYEVVGGWEPSAKYTSGAQIPPGYPGKLWAHTRLRGSIQNQACEGRGWDWASPAVWEVPGQQGTAEVMVGLRGSHRGLCSVSGGTL